MFTDELDACAPFFFFFFFFVAHLEEALDVLHIAPHPDFALLVPSHHVGTRPQRTVVCLRWQLQLADRGDLTHAHFRLVVQLVLFGRLQTTDTVSDSDS